MRGTPGSGKSILATLLKIHIEEKFEGEVEVRKIEWSLPARDALRAEISDAIKSTQRRIVLIIDEAQLTYPETGLWALFKNVEDFEGIYVIGFASYGSQFYSEQLSTAVPARDTIAAARTITLRHIDHEDECGVAGLLFTEVEFNGMVQQWYRNGHPPIAQPLLDALYESTAGHIGAIHDFLDLLWSPQVSSALVLPRPVSNRCSKAETSLAGGGVVHMECIQDRLYERTGPIYRSILVHIHTIQEGFTS